MRPRHLALLGALALQTCGTLMPVPAAEYPAPDMSEWYSSLMIPDSMPALCRFCCRSRLMNAVADDSVSLTRFVAEARDDGAAQSRPEAAFLFVLP